MINSGFDQVACCVINGGFEGVGAVSQGVGCVVEHPVAVGIHGHIATVHHGVGAVDNFNVHHVASTTIGFAEISGGASDQQRFVAGDEVGGVGACVIADAGERQRGVGVGVGRWVVVRVAAAAVVDH